MALEFYHRINILLACGAGDEPQDLGHARHMPYCQDTPRSRFEVSPLDCKNYQTSVLPKKALETWLYSLNLSAVTKIAGWPWWWKIAWYQEQLCLLIWPAGKTVGKSSRRVVKTCCHVHETEGFLDSSLWVRIIISTATVQKGEEDGLEFVFWESEQDECADIQL